MRSPRACDRTLKSLRAAAFLVAVAGGVALAPAASAADTPTPVASRAGDVVVVDGQENLTKIAGGGSGKDFSFRLPPGSTCPGDSAHDQWRVQTFIVPASVDPATLKYGVIGPEGDHQFALFDSLTTHTQAHVLLQPNTGSGKPGRIITFPALTLRPLPPGSLPSGNYRIGVACTYFRQPDKYWDTEIIITESPDDKPAQFTWRLLNPPAPEAGDSAVSRGLVFGVVGLGAAAVGIGLILSRRRRLVSHTNLRNRESR